MNPSGGLRWHWRAWRSRTLWAPTCKDIATWLAQVQPRSKELILLGPSAGWMLPTDWLLRFERIHAVDIDPWGARFFAYRHGAALQAGGTRWQYQTGDALADLPRLLTVHPQACVMFDNLLGQLRFHAPRWQDPLTFTAQQLADIHRLLRGREWGSVHDLLSGPALGLASGQEFPAARLPGRTQPTAPRRRGSWTRPGWPLPACKASGWTISLRKCFRPARRCAISPGLSTVATGIGCRPAGSHRQRSEPIQQTLCMI